MAMVNKHEIPGLCLAALVGLVLISGGYVFGGYDERTSVRELVRVSCERPVTIGWLDPGRTEPTYYVCSPKDPPLEIRGTEAGAIILP